jgi:hypothetical protein
MHSFTPEDLLLLAYNETSTTQAIALEEALRADWTLNEEYQAICATKQQLSTIELAPRKKALDFIFEYAERTTRELSPEV